jgi:hypothetical protein
MRRSEKASPLQRKLASRLKNPTEPKYVFYQKPQRAAKPPFVRKLKAQPETFEECPAATKIDGSTRYCLAVEQKATRRCETSYLNYVKCNVETTISFDFRLDNSWGFHDVWISIFQVHSHPDKDEKWRCPVTALEVQGHTLRMFPPQRSDANFNAGQWQLRRCRKFYSSPRRIRQRADPSGAVEPFRTESEFQLRQKRLDLAIKLNNTKVANLTGPNTYNDQRMPFVKIRIYKPSSWANAKKPCVDYRNISIVSGKR